MAALVTLVLAVTFTTWLRSHVDPRYQINLTIQPLPYPQQPKAGFTVLGLWRLSAMSESFGGYSAMSPPGDRVRLFSDKGWLLTISRPDRPGDQVSLRQLYPVGIPLVDLLDIESVTYNRQTGQYWVGYENHHTIYRYSPAGEPQAYVEPAYARNWGANSGIEAMVRMDDGRFLILRETNGEGYLYPSDPTQGARPMAFHVDWPDDFSPTDMVQLPDGRVLVLLRKVGFHLPVFESLVAIGDPGTIDSDKAWQVANLLRVEDLLPRDNWEAMSLAANADGSTELWLASDDNLSAFQRSLLAKLRFDPPPRVDNAAVEAPAAQ